MFRSSRQATVFGAGLLLGIVAGASVLSGWQPTEAAPAPAAAVSVSRAAACAYDVLLPAAPAQDGKFAAPMDAVGKTRTDVPAYIAVGDDAQQQGRIRDAEVAYITACRIAGQLADADAPELADARSSLARHYLKFAGTGSAREAALERARTLFSESVTAYGQALGITNEKTALAAGGLAAVQEALAVPEPPLAVPPILLAERSSPDYGLVMENTKAIAAAARKARRLEEEQREREELMASATTTEPASATAATPTLPTRPQPQADPQRARPAASPNVPVCLAGDCPASITREPVLHMQSARELGSVTVSAAQGSANAVLPPLPPEPAAP